MRNSYWRSKSAALLLGSLLGISTQAFAQGADFCWSETWGRGVGTVPTTCGADQEKNGLLCYPKCQAGYASDGVAGCIQSCPSGSRDDGLFCGWASYKAAEYPVWDEAKCKSNHPTGCWLTVPAIGVWVENCRAGYKHVAGFCEISNLDCPAMGFGARIANSCTKKLYFRDTALPTCGSGQEYDAGLCYTGCGDSADGVGPVCWAKGPPGWVQCGAGWAATQAICDQNISSQVISVIDAAVSTTMLIGSLGASAAGKIAANTGVKVSSSVFKKTAWEGVKQIGKAGVKDVLIKAAKTTAVSSITSVPDAVLTTTNGTVEQLWQIGQLEHDSPNMTQVERDHAIAQIALNTAAWLDPTGVTGVVAAYSKPVCKDVSAMTTRSLTATDVPSGGLLQIMKSDDEIKKNFSLQRAEAEADFTTATAVTSKLQTSYNAATGDAKTQLQAQLTAAQTQQQAAKAQLDKVIAAQTQFATVAARWDPIAATATTAAPATPTLSWGETSYKAYDIAAGANGAVWFISAATSNGSDGGIYRVTSSGPQQVAGAAMRIAVDPAGIPWVVNSGNQIYRWNGTSWQLMPGAARDVGIGANGAVWVIGTDQSPYKWNGSGWSKGSGGAVLISVDPTGNPWVVNAGGQIWRYDGAKWILLPGAARDIGVGADGTVYVVGSGTGNSQVWRWVPGSNNWVAESGVAGFSVAAGPGGTVYVARSRDSGMAVMTREPR